MRRFFPRYPREKSTGASSGFDDPTTSLAPSSDGADRYAIAQRGGGVKIYRHLSDVPRRARSIAIGIFDGIHRGHRKILDALLRDAARHRTTPLVVTFDPHPAKVLRHKTRVPVILSLPHRLRLLEEIGIKEVLVIAFNKSFSRISAERFLESLLIKRLGMQSLIVGWDFRFGRGAEGDAEFLKARRRPFGYRLKFIPPLKDAKGVVISSTRIRKLVERGRLEKATKLLGRPVSLYGDVVPGRGRGAQTGFPTANLNPHHETLPPSGVYAAEGVLDGRRFLGVVHIGKRPTFGDREKSVEVHFLNFHKNIYGKEVELFFLKRIRGIRRFANAQALSRQIEKDVRSANLNFT